MKRVPNAILFVISSKTSYVPSVLTHHLFVNRIPCLEENLHEAKMIELVEKEMKEYPITKQPARSELKEDAGFTNHRRSTSAQLMKCAYEFVNQSNYLLIEETKQILRNMNETEINENEITLEMLKKSVAQCMLREELNDYAVFEIRALLSQIVQMQEKKSNKVV